MFQNDPMIDSDLWMHQFPSQLNKQYRRGKLTSTTKNLDLIDVNKFHILASGGIGSYQGQNEINLDSTKSR